MVEMWVGEAASWLVGLVVLCFAAFVWRMLTNADWKDVHIRSGAQRRRLLADHKTAVIPGVRYESRYISTRDGRIMHTDLFVPEGTVPRGVLCYCHGYSQHVLWTSAASAQRLALATGMAVTFIDYHGHGRSDGLCMLVTSFDALVNDVVDYFTSLRTRFNNVPLFLYGNSMGGCVALHATLAHPGTFAGAVLVAPMVQIAPEIRPKEPILSGVIYLSKILPWAAITPTPDLMKLCVKDPVKREHILADPIVHRGRGRLATARECYLATVNLEQRLREVQVPFIVLHGAEDVVTSPRASQLLYDKAASSDKSIRIYPDKLHALTTGEPDESIAETEKDMSDWLNARLDAAFAGKPSPHLSAGMGGTRDVFSSSSRASTHSIVDISVME